MQKKCGKTNLVRLNDEIKNLPEAQQECIRACINAARRKTGQGNRYTIRWIYHCLLIRIKSRKAYEHLRNNKILALPSITTMQRYISKIKPTYGFLPEVFRILKEKSAKMKPFETRGTLVLDEMKLSPTVKFDTQDMRFIGFVDLGEYTPPEQKNKEGDHALVFVFQPFAGSWIQAIGSFLSKSCAKGTVLHELIVEAILLLENAGFQVDAVVSDGATWNRAVWTLNQINRNEISCSHFYSDSRRLWFLSDFSHLIKNLRNWILKVEEFWTSDGLVQLKFWQEIINRQKKEGLHLCPKLSANHIDLKQYQKMNVAMAFQFFGIDVVGTLEDLKEELDDDPTPTMNFIRRIHNLIKAMNSRSPKGALRENSTEWKNISDFLVYLEEWNNLPRERKCDFFSDSTYVGLVISLKATLELQKSLQIHGLRYLMTSRVNQDCIEHFFGIVRQSAGNNNNPDSYMFILIFRLLVFYSLVKPPKGSNVGGDLLKSLITPDDQTSSSSVEKDDLMNAATSNSKTVNQKRWDEILNKIITGAEDIENAGVYLYEGFEKDSATEFFCGYLIKHAKKIWKCEDCIKTLQASESEKMSSYFETRDEFLVLNRPCAAFVALIQTLEKYVTAESQSELCAESFFNIVCSIQEDQEEGNFITVFGCNTETHKFDFSRRIINFFLITRMHFVTRFINRGREKAKSSRNQKKIAILTT